MAMDTWDTATVYQALLNGRSTVKQQAIFAIDAGSTALDREQLRGLLMTALRRDFRAPRPGAREDAKSADTRCWLLSALGRVAGTDTDAAAEVRRHLEPAHEPYAWARFWTLEGLIHGKPPDLENLAEGVVAREEEAQVVMSLAQVVLASRGHDAALDAVRKGLESHKADEKWAMLRSLRVVPSMVPLMVDELCAIVDAGAYNDMTFDAIVALGRLAPENQYSEVVAQSLANFVVQHRWPSYEAMRAKAIIGLGNLRVERTGAILIEELLDDSPAIVYEASRAVEKVLGVRTATARLIEASQRTGRDAVMKYANALRWMERNAVVEALESVMLTAPETQQFFARELLSEVGGQYAFQRLRARTDAATKYTDALEQAEEKIRLLFQTSIEEAQHGFRMATRMDLTVFGLGIVLIAVSAALLLVQGQGLDKWAGVGLSGGAGVLSVLYTMFVAKPRAQVREAVDHLMYLKVVFLGYLRQLHQTDQAFTRRLLDDQRLPADEVKQFADMVGVTMAGAIQQLSSRGQAAAGRGEKSPVAVPTVNLAAPSNV